MTPNSVWGLMALAIAFETAGATMLKLAGGFQRPLWFLAAIAAYVVCFVFFAQAIRHIPLSVAYAIWGGVGAVVIVAIDLLIFGEALGALKVGFIAMIVVGVVGLKLTT